MTDRIEQAAPDVRGVLEAAYNRIFCRDTLAGFMCEPCDRLNRFMCFLDAEAYTDAALMLVAEGCGISINRYWTATHDSPVWSCELTFGGIPSDPRRVFSAFDHTAPALAIAAAALRAKGPGHA